MSKALSISHRVQTAITVGNAIELVASVICEIAGNDISDELNGAPVSREAVGQLVIANINTHFGKLQGVNRA